MRVKIGYEMVYACPPAPPMIVTTNVHFSRASDLETPDHVVTRPRVPITHYRDSFGNWCVRLTAPKGQFTITASAILHDSGELDVQSLEAKQHPVDAPD